MNVFENSDDKARQIWDIIEKSSIPFDDKQRLCKLLSDFRTETIKDIEQRQRMEFDSLRKRSFDYWQMNI